MDVSQYNVTRLLPVQQVDNDEYLNMVYVLPYKVSVQHINITLIVSWNYTYHKLSCLQA